MTYFKNKTVIMSGGSRGVGLEIAKALGKDGANVAILAKTTEPHPTLPGTIFTAAEEIEQVGGAALPIVCDIRYEEQVEAAVEETASKFGSIDICINIEALLADLESHILHLLQCLWCMKIFLRVIFCI